MILIRTIHHYEMHNDGQCSYSIKQTWIMIFLVACCARNVKNFLLNAFDL